MTKAKLTKRTLRTLATSELAVATGGLENNYDKLELLQMKFELSGGTGDADMIKVQQLTSGIGGLIG